MAVIAHILQPQSRSRLFLCVKTMKSFVHTYVTFFPVLWPLGFLGLNRHMDPLICLRRVLNDDASFAFLTRLHTSIILGFIRQIPN